MKRKTLFFVTGSTAIVLIGYMLIGIIGCNGTTTHSSKKNTDTFIDKRDGKSYRWVKIGDQVWMAENLAYRPNEGRYWTYNYEQSNIAKYGFYYDWETACKVCPTGWHLPRDEEWDVLEKEIGRDSAGKKLKSTKGWRKNGNGDNSIGFNALPGGFRFSYTGYFSHKGISGRFWSATDKSADDAWFRNLDSGSDAIVRKSVNKEFGLSVRCLRN